MTDQAWYREEHDDEAPDYVVNRTLEYEVEDIPVVDNGNRLATLTS